MFSPVYQPDPRRAEMIADLAAPLHDRSRRVAGREAAAGEADFSKGYELSVADPEAAERLAATVDDFHRFMSVAMEIPVAAARHTIEARLGAPEGCPSGKAEAWHLRVTESGATLTGSDAEGLRRGLVYLEDEMLAQGGPFLPVGEV